MYESQSNMTPSSVCKIQWHDGGGKEAIKISVTRHLPVHETNDLGEIRIDDVNSMCWETRLVVTDAQLTVE